MSESPRIIAAVDLGSNSFHMVIARYQDGQVQIIDRIKEMVRLAAGLEDDGTLSTEARQRALECLQRFGERLKGLADENVRAVGTNTLRKVRDPRAFLEEIEASLGHPVEIISGLEEARLVYKGVAHTVEPDKGRRLVIDIGGGSTEFVIGDGFESIKRESKFMGCVGFTRLFFPDGEVTEKRMERAILAAKQEVEVLATEYQTLGWKEAIGSSGTNKAIASILDATGWSPQQITARGLEKIKERVIKDGYANTTRLPGLSERRAPVFPAGLAILIGAFEILGIEKMFASDGALREGLLYDQLGRLQSADIREQTVAVMCARYGVDMRHADRVETTAIDFLHALKGDWEIQTPYMEKLLRWSARLHEIGLAISHSRYHKHGSYLVENSDMAGFSRQDQQLLWAMVRSHRNAFKLHRYTNTPNHLAKKGQRLTIILRLAIRLNRNRLDDQVPPVALCGTGKELALRFPKGWLDRLPLTRVVLEEEAAHLRRSGFLLAVEEG